MTTNKLKINYLEFYITNVCNLTCNECNRFNNLNFRGWQKWEDYAEIYEKWSKEIDIGYYGILGGEPLLNPTFYQWVEGLQTLWPGITCQIGSNGTQLDKHKKFYEYLVKYKKTLKYNVSCHNENHYEILKEKIRNFMTHPIEENFDDSKFKKYFFLDKNGIVIKLTQEWLFQKNAILVNKDTGRKTLHQSDREKAHLICYNKYCHHFDKGELYKCGPGALFKQIDEQFELDLNHEDKELIKNYKPLNINDSFETKKIFTKNLPYSISLCKFCPATFSRKKFHSIEKKNFSL